MDWVDCHFHVIECLQRFAMLAERSYTPATATFESWKATLAPLGFRRGVVVQPSFYGTDNTVLLNALRQGGGALAGVGAASEDVTEQGLDALASAGVRALRFSHLSAHQTSAARGFVPLSALKSLAPRMRARGMHVDLLTDSRLLPQIEAELRALQMPVVLDHMGRAPASLGHGHEGIKTMQRLLGEGWFWVKLSGIANISTQSPFYDDVRCIHDLLLATCPARLLWGSDWPHTRPMGQPPHTPDLLQRFIAWTDSKEVQSLILDQNPSELYSL